MKNLKDQFVIKASNGVKEEYLAFVENQFQMSSKVISECPIFSSRIGATRFIKRNNLKKTKGIKLRIVPLSDCKDDLVIVTDKSNYHFIKVKSGYTLIGYLFHNRETQQYDMQRDKSGAVLFKSKESAEQFIEEADKLIISEYTYHASPMNPTSEEQEKEEAELQISVLLLQVAELKWNQFIKRRNLNNQIAKIKNKYDII